MGKFEKLFSLDICFQDVYGKLITTIRKCYVHNNKLLLKKNIQLKNKAKSNVCNIFGLGPSLKNVNYNELKGDMIVVNRFYVMDKGMTEPLFYILSDNAFFEEPLINELPKMYSLYPKTIFLLDGLRYCSIKSVLPDDDRVYYIFSGNGVFNHKNQIDYTKWVPIKYNVVSEAIGVAMFVGYDNIHLYGCDYNSFANQKACHCYYEKDDSRKISLFFELFMYSFTTYVHMELSKYAKSHGVVIVNENARSLLDTYERKIM